MEQDISCFSVVTKTTNIKFLSKSSCIEIMITCQFCRVVDELRK